MHQEGHEQHQPGAEAKGGEPEDDGQSSTNNHEADGKDDALTHNPSKKHEQNRVADDDLHMHLTGSPSKHDAKYLDKDEDMNFTGQPGAEAGWGCEGGGP